MTAPAGISLPRKTKATSDQEGKGDGTCGGPPTRSRNAAPPAMKRTRSTRESRLRRKPSSRLGWTCGRIIFGLLAPRRRSTCDDALDLDDRRGERRRLLGVGDDVAELAQVDLLPAGWA